MLLLPKSRHTYFCMPFLFIILNLLACSSSNTGDFVSNSRFNSINSENSNRLLEIESRLFEITKRLEELEYVKFKELEKSNSIPNENKEIVKTIQESPRLAPAIKPVPSSIIPQELLIKDKDLASKMNTDAGIVFLQALTAIEEANYTNVQALINEAYDLNYRKPDSAKILFWKGILYELDNDNKKAIGVYAEIVNKYSKDVRSREALLRQASVFIRLKEKELAKVTLQKLIADYPGSQEAKKAKTRLSDL